MRKNNYKYRLSSTGDNSKTFGVCEICGESASEVWTLSESQEYEINTKDFQHSGFTENFTFFGHINCLKKRIKESARDASEIWLKAVDKDFSAAELAGYYEALDDLVNKGLITIKLHKRGKK